MGRVMLESIRAKNFKSFDGLDMSLDRFHAVIGANAAGKSNLVQLFAFLRDLRSEGLDYALALQGGIEYARNFNGSNTNMIIEIKIRSSDGNPLKTMIRKELEGWTWATWRLELKLGEKSGYEIVDDTWRVGVRTTKREPGTQFDFIMEIKRKGTQVSGVVESSSHGASVDLQRYVEMYVLDEKDILIEPFFIVSRTFPDIGRFFDGIAVYDFDPKHAKGPARLRGMPDLEGDGSNLAIVLKEIMENKDSRGKFSNLVRDLLPFIKSVNTKGSPDKSILYTVSETYFDRTDIPSSMISDGTANAIALLAALYFEPKSLIVIEEPEKNIHPSLIASVVDLMKDAASGKQIIATTHNPEMVTHVGLDNLVLIKRDSDGFSRIKRPAEQEEVKEFLKDEMDMRLMYVQNILG